MKLKAFVAAGVLSVSTIAGATAAVAATPSTATPGSEQERRSCLPEGADDAWPGIVQGTPDGFHPGDTGGVYLWHDRDGWHLRVTHANDDKKIVSGRITTKGKLTRVDGARLEKGDMVKTGPDGHVLEFRFRNYGHIDGVDFRTACAPALHFAFATGGHKVPVDRVFLGDERAHPDSNPFTIKRQA
jgi:hypothetical protein